MPDPARIAIDPGRLIDEMRRLVREAESWRIARVRRRSASRWRLLLLALLISIPSNLLLLLLLPRTGGGVRPQSPAVAVEVRVPPRTPAGREPERTPPAEPRESSPPRVASLPLPLPPPRSSAPRGSLAAASALSPTGGEALASGIAETSFFGISGRGRRIAYIVDISASMESGGRLWAALDELDRSLSALPDYAHFAVVLFANEAVIPPFGRVWQRATPANLDRMREWLRRSVTTGGGTRPAGAFEAVFSLSPRPEAVFFLTDGEIPGDTPMLLERLNTRGERAAVNTIAFGDEAGVAPLERIARDSGGSFRFVPAGSR